MRIDQANATKEEYTDRYENRVHYENLLVDKRELIEIFLPVQELWQHQVSRAKKDH